MMPCLQNAAIDAMEAIIKCTDLHPDGAYRYIYQNTSTDSHLRRYVCKRFCHDLDEQSFKEAAKWCPRDMLVDVTTQLLISIGSPDMEDVSAKEFHVDEKLS